MNRPVSRSCPVRERTGDGVSVGRCYYPTEDGVCPRHGDVREPLRRFNEDGRLTDENDLPPRPSKSFREPDPPRKSEPPSAFMQLVGSLRKLIT